MSTILHFLVSSQAMCSWIVAKWFEHDDCSKWFEHDDGGVQEAFTEIFLLHPYTDSSLEIFFKFTLATFKFSDVQPSLIQQTTSRYYCIAKSAFFWISCIFMLPIHLAALHLECIMLNLHLVYDRLVSHVRAEHTGCLTKDNPQQYVFVCTSLWVFLNMHWFTVAFISYACWNDE